MLCHSSMTTCPKFIYSSPRCTFLGQFFAQIPLRSRWLQVLRHADVLHYMGLIDKRQRINALQQQLEVAELITLGALAWCCCARI